MPSALEVKRDENMFIPTDRVSQLYMTVFAQEFSPCGKYLAAANGYGQIGLHELAKSFQRRNRDKTRRSMNKFQAHEDPIFSLTSNEKYLISGGIGQIKGWRWSEIVTAVTANNATADHSVVCPSWTINVPVNKAVGSRPEINAMIVSQTDDVLYAAAGDGNIYAWSLETSEYKVISLNFRREGTGKEGSGKFGISKKSTKLSKKDLKSRSYLRFLQAIYFVSTMVTAITFIVWRSKMIVFYFPVVRTDRSAFGTLTPIHLASPFSVSENELDCQNEGFRQSKARSLPLHGHKMPL